MSDEMFNVLSMNNSQTNNKMSEICETIIFKFLRNMGPNTALRTPTSLYMDIFF